MKKCVFKKGDLDRFFGCAKGLTGELNSREYIAEIREEKEFVDELPPDLWKVYATGEWITHEKT